MPYHRQLDLDTRIALKIGEWLHRLKVWLKKDGGTTNGR